MSGLAQLVVLVRQRDPDAPGARRRIEVGIDERDLAVERAAGQVGERDAGRVALGDPRKIGLVDVGLDPDLVEIGDPDSRLLAAIALP